MPKQKEQQYEDALGSIFDFIFDQSQKPPHKVKPAKVTGVDGASEFADALVATIENPLMFVNNSSLESFNELADIDLAQIKVGDRGLPIKFNLQDIGAIIKDPGKFVDNKFAILESIRKSQRIAHAGEEIRSVVAGTWAKKNGLDFETRRAVGQVGRPDAYEHDLMERADKLMEDHFSSTSGTYDRTRKRRHKMELIRRYGPEKGERLHKMYQKAKAAYDSGDPNQKARIYSGFELEDSPPEDKGKRQLLGDLYSYFEAENIRGKAATERDTEKRLAYIRAARFVDNIAMLDDVDQQYRAYSKSIDFHKERIRDLARSGGSRADIAMHKKRLRELKDDRNMVRQYKYASKLGEMEGLYYTAKDYFVDGNLLPSLINGKFFDGRYNQISWLQPSQEKKKKIKVRGRGGTLYEGELAFHQEKFKGKRDRLGNYVRDRFGNIEVENGWDKFSNDYYEGMNAFYYMSPVTLVKSLVTGEIFAYRAYLGEKRFMRMMTKKLKNLSAGGKDINPFLDKLNLDGDKKGLAFLFEKINAGEGADFLNEYADLLDSLGLTEEFKKFITNQEKFNKLAYQFSAVKRLRAAIEEKAKALIYKITKMSSEDLRNMVGQKLLKVAFIKKFSSVAVNAWIKKGGLYGLAKGIVVGAMKALGFTFGGPVASLIAGAVALLVTNLIMKVTKPIIKVTVRGLVWALAGLVAVPFVFVLLFSMMFSKFTHVAPIDVVECEAYANLGLTPLEPIGDDVNFDCEDGETVQSLFQRYLNMYGLSGITLRLVPPGHPDYEAMWERTWCIARYSEVYCKSDRVNNCRPGISALFHHEVVHLVQYRNASGSYSGLFMEWGAELISHNGGGYRFRTSDGSCILATQTPRNLNGCSDEILRGIAFNEAQYVGSQCFASLRSFILGYC